MSEKIVIIGNGFDLRHFLPTKYNHLITILREIEKLEFNTISEVNFETLFGKLFKEKDEWFYEKIKEFYKTSEINFDVQELKSIQQRIKINNWFQYLKSVEDYKIETWIDFETEIERILKFILTYFDQTSNGIYKYPLHNGSKDGDFYFSRFDSQNFISNNLQINILSFFKLFDLNNDRGIVFINKNYILDIDSQIQNYHEKLFFDFVYNSLEEFTGVFNDYIAQIINVFYENFKEERRDSFINLGNKFLFDKVNKIFSFNYTDTYSKFYKSKNEVENEFRGVIRSGFFNGTDFLHGKSIENWNGNLEKLKIVLGVNDIDPLLKNHKLFQFTKYFQKLHRNTDYLFLDKIIKNIKLKLPYEIDFIFWGHSLDVSDKDYINDVFYITEKTRSQIKIFYHSISGKADQLKNLLNIIDKNMIESMMKNNKLVFIESTPENLFEEL